MTCPRNRFGLRMVAVLLPMALAVAITPPADGAGMNLHRGSRGAAVKVLETRLAQLHLLRRSAVDRRYRLPTVRAVKRFQRTHRPLRVTGRVNQRTWDALATATRPKPVYLPVPDLVGHRGAVGATTPENTLRALSIGAVSAKFLEFDLQWTSDRQIVLMHDSTLDRTTDCTGRVDQWSLADLRAQCHVDVAGAPEVIPTFTEAAELLAPTGRSISPELKPADLEDADLADFISVVEQNGLTSRTYVQSFQPLLLPRVRGLNQQLQTVYTSVEPPAVAAVRAAGAGTVAVSSRSLTSANVAAYRSAGIRVWSWTARTLEQLAAARTLRVDAVITDIPGEAAAYYASVR